MLIADEFKPASIDNSQPGLLHKGKDNRVTVEFQNNHQGKPKVIFEGVSEDYRGNDAVMFFDGETFQLERLGRAVKRLRRVRIPGDPSTAAVSTMATLAAPALESHSPAVDKGSKVQQPLNTDVIGEAVSLRNSYPFQDSIMKLGRCISCKTISCTNVLS